MKYFTLSLIAVLAMASVSMAGYTVEINAVKGMAAHVSDPVELDFGLVAYTVTMINTNKFRNHFLMWINPPEDSCFTEVIQQEIFLFNLPRW